MENQNEKIANLKLHITKESSELEIKVLEAYWKLDKLEPINTASVVRKKFNITQYQLTKTYKLATLSFYIYCEHCNSYESRKAQSHAKLKEELRKINLGHYNSFKCDYCLEAKRIEVIKKVERLREEQEFLKKNNMMKAFKNREWESLSYFQRSILHKSINLDINNLIKYFKTKQDYTFYWRTLYHLDNLHLIKLVKNDSNFIENIEFLEELKESFYFNPDEQKSKAEFNSETNELKLKLTVDNERIHPDSPVYAGTITFKEKIVLKANVEYIFGQWERANNNMFLTLTPMNELDKRPTQKTISRLPISIKKGVNIFLRNMGKTLDF